MDQVIITAALTGAVLKIVIQLQTIIIFDIISVNRKFFLIRQIQ